MSRLPGILPPADALDSDDWYTPPYIIEAIGLTYDLDPCAPKGGVPWIPAAAHLTEQDDGLSQPWHGRVWLNPPYSDPSPWVRKLADHGNGIGLIQADTSVGFWHEVVVTADVILFLRGRVKFVQPGDDRAWNARFASAIAAWGADNARAVARSNLGWCVRSTPT